MTEKDLKKFQSIVRAEIDGAVVPIKQELSRVSKALGFVKKDVSSVKTELSTVKKDVSSVKTELSTVKKDVSSVKKTLATHDRKLDALVAEVHDLHSLTGAIWDQISINDVKTQRELNEIRTHINLPRN